MAMAQPYLEETFRKRCQARIDKHWCDKKPRDYIVQKGDYYYISRTAYPYKSIYAYLNYAVRVHVQNGTLHQE